MSRSVALLVVAAACVQVPDASIPDDAIFSLDGRPYTASMRDARPDAAVVRERLGLGVGEPLPEIETRGLEDMMLLEALAARRAALLGWEAGEPPFPSAEMVALAADRWGPPDVMGGEDSRTEFLTRHGITRESLLAHVRLLLVEGAVVETYIAVRDGDVHRCLEQNKADLDQQWEREVSGLREADRTLSYTRAWAENWCRIAIDQRRRSSPDYQGRVREAIGRGAEVVWHRWRDDEAP